MCVAALIVLTWVLLMLSTSRLSSSNFTLPRDIDLSSPISTSPLLKKRVSFTWAIPEKGRMIKNNHLLMFRIFFTNTHVLVFIMLFYRIGKIGIQIIGCIHYRESTLR